MRSACVLCKILAKIIQIKLVFIVFHAINVLYIFIMRNTINYSTDLSIKLIYLDSEIHYNI